MISHWLALFAVAGLLYGGLVGLHFMSIQPKKEYAMPKKQSSSGMSATAGKYLKFKLTKLNAMNQEQCKTFEKDIRAMAASVLSQDEMPAKSPPSKPAPRKGSSSKRSR